MWAVLFILWLASLYALPVLLLGSSSFLFYLSIEFYSFLHKTPVYCYTQSQRTPLSFSENSVDYCKLGGTREVFYRNQMVLPGWIYIHIIRIFE